jgi:uncharacterized membrane protein
LYFKKAFFKQFRGGFITSEIQQAFTNIALSLKLIAEISSVIIVGIGLVVALFIFVRTVILRQIQYNRLRLLLGRFLIVGLEFQLAGDIIGTAVAPSWEEIAQLAAIALIRTFLNYFLNREVKSEEIGEEKQKTLVKVKKESA